MTSTSLPRRSFHALALRSESRRRRLARPAGSRTPHRPDFLPLEDRALLALSTTTLLSVSSNAATYGRPVTLTATVQIVPPNGFGINTFAGTTVSFIDNSSTIGTAALTQLNSYQATATFTVSAPSVGTHNFSAFFNGNSSLIGSYSSGYLGVAAGGGTLGDGNPAVMSSTLANPGGVAVDRDGNTYVVEMAANRVRMISKSTGLISTVAGTGTAGFSGDGGSATSATLYSPTGLTVDALGNIYIVDQGNQRIREVVKATGKIVTIAGNGGSGYNGDGILATSATLYGPNGVAVDTAGNVYIADTYNSRIRKVAAGTGIITTVVGTGSLGFNGDNLSGTSTTLYYPRGVALDSTGNLYIADLYNNRIRKFNLASGLVSTVAGNGVTSGWTSGQSATGPIGYPEGVAVDAQGNIYISNGAGPQIGKVASGVLTTIAGVAGTQANSSEGSLANSAPIGWSLYLTVDASDTVLFSDYNFSKLRTVGQNATVTVSQASTAVAVTITSNNLTFGQSAGLTASVAAIGSAAIPTGSVQFLVDGVNFGSATAVDAFGNAFISTASIGVGSHTYGATFTASDSTKFANAASATSALVTVGGDGRVGWISDGVAATSTPIYNPLGVARDSAGNIYIADTLDNRVRKVNASTGLITTIAGTGTAGFSGDGGLATSAQLNAPSGVAVDSSGNVFIADRNNQRIRKITAATGFISTIVGNGFTFYSGDGAGTSTTLNNPLAVALDSTGNVYIADYGNQRIRKWTASTSNVSTVAGSGTQGYGGDNASATVAGLNNPEGVAVDSSGNIYIADFGNNRIRKVTVATGNISTIAGNGSQGFAGDGGAATAANLNLPQGVAVDASGNVYIADTGNQRIRKINVANGVISTFAGTGTAAYNGDGVNATSSSLNFPNGLVVDGSGNAYIADQVNHRIRLVTASTGLISTYAGTGQPGYDGDQSATNSSLWLPMATAVDASGNIFVADYFNNRIRMISGGQMSTIAGTGIAGFSGDGGDATLAAIRNPAGIALDASGNVIFTDSGNNRIRKINRSTGVITTIGGTGTASSTGDGGAATSATFNAPFGLAIRPGNGTIFVSELNGNRVRTFNEGGIVALSAGNGIPNFSGDGGTPQLATLNQPTAIAFDASGNLYIADSGNNRIRKVTSTNSSINTIIGNGATVFAGDGLTGTNTPTYSPFGVAADSSGNVYFSDLLNRVRKLTTSTGLVTTVTGDGISAYNGSPLPVSAAELASPRGLTFDSSGNLYIADGGSNRVRKLILAASTFNVSAASTTSNLTRLSPNTYGQSVQFTVSVTSAPQSPAGTVQFLVDGSNFGSPVTVSAGVATSLSTTSLTAGTHTISVAFTPLSTNFSSSSDTMSLVVNKAHLTVTASAPGKTYDGSALSGFGVGYSGFVNNETTSVLSGAPGFTGSAVGAINAGTYTLTPTLGTLSAANYDFTPFISGSVSIAKVHLTVTADAKTKTYDGSAFSPFTSTLSGFVNGETAAVVSGSAGYTGTAVGATNAGSYVITPTQGSLTATNYDFTTFNNGSLVIGKAHLTVTADGKSKTYDGSAFSPFTSTITGFVNGETAAVVSGSAGYTGTAVGATNAGSYVITPTQGSLTATNYDFPSLVNGSLTIGKAHLTVTADGKSKTYDGSAFSPFTSTITGFVNGETAAVVSGTAGYTGTAVGATNAGSYVITPTQGSLTATNYDFPSLVNGSLTIDKVHLTVTADAKSKTYDGAAFSPFTSTITGFVNSETAAVVSGSAGYTGTAVGATNAGSYVITPTQGTLTATNYDFPSLVNGSLTINKAHLTVTADGKSKTYDGSAFSPFTATITGFVNGETAAVVSGTAGYTGTAVGATNAGSYVITPTQGSLASTNYDFTTFNNGSLVIGKAHLTVTADGKSKTYDGSAFSPFTSTITGFVNSETASVVSGSAGYTGTAVGATNAGSYVITPTQGSLTATNYDFTTFNNGSLVIGKVHLTVTADAKSKTYDGVAFSPFTSTITGFVNSETASVVSGSAGYTGTAVGATNAGSYVITPTQGSLDAVNYDFTNFVNDSLTIDKAHLTVTGDALSKTYDGSPYSPISATITGFVNGEDASVVSGSPEFVGMGVDAINVGTYSFTPLLGTLSATNYDFPTRRNGSVTIDKAHLTVTADSKSKTYDGSSYSPFTSTITGFVNGENTSAVSGSAGYAGTAVGATNAGSYVITPTLGTLDALNYDFLTFQDGSLTIGKAHLTVTALLPTTDIGRGDPIPTPTSTISGFVNGETSAVVSGTVSYTGLPDTSSPAGIYTVNPVTTGLSATNYDFPNVVPATLKIHPKITDVLVRWGSRSMSILGLGRDLPFSTINAIEVKFTDPVDVSGTGLALTSTAGGAAYSPSKSGSGLGTTDQVWTLPTAIGIDRLLSALDALNIGASVAPSLKLFGPTSFEFAVLPGDFNGDGVVTASDMTGINNASILPYNVWADLDGDGRVDINDVKIAKAKQGSKLPPRI